MITAWKIIWSITIGNYQISISKRDTDAEKEYDFIGKNE